MGTKSLWDCNKASVTAGTGYLGGMKSESATFLSDGGPWTGSCRELAGSVQAKWSTGWGLAVWVLSRSRAGSSIIETRELDDTELEDKEKTSALMSVTLLSCGPVLKACQVPEKEARPWRGSKA